LANWSIDSRFLLSRLSESLAAGIFITIGSTIAVIVVVEQVVDGAASRLYYTEDFFNQSMGV
jgi:hypothetical protein